ncbi:MAG: YegS/Rv2252/BmrU family lipid kinase [Chitinophagaceae bacterium]|nr:MAG: YegS/Rv2252/BmrU family lipid kinase [Chitinophagaceae bacterium]
MHSEKHIAIVCNRLAGSGRAVTLANKISEVLNQKKIIHTLFNGDWPKTFEGITNIFIVGGDGTLNYFVNQYSNIQLPLAVFNGGTGNDFHWLLYGKISFEDQLELVLKATPRTIDGGRCNDKYFINGVGIGFEGAVAKSLTGKKKLPGKTSFMLAILQKIFFYRSRTYQVKIENEQFENTYFLISVMNGKRAGGGFYIAPNATITDGLLEVVIIKKLHPLKRLRWLPVIEKGKHMQLSIVESRKISKINIQSNTIIEAHLDGEYYEADKLEIEILEGRYLFCY